jgi:hypothetical protein
MRRFRFFSSFSILHVTLYSIGKVLANYSFALDRVLYQFQVRFSGKPPTAGPHSFKSGAPIAFLPRLSNHARRPGTPPGRYQPTMMPIRSSGYQALVFSQTFFFLYLAVLALICLLSGDEGIRTPGLRLAKAALSQLSYIPRYFVRGVGLTGFEPGTPALSAQCSNHLSYRPSNAGLNN